MFGHVLNPNSNLLGVSTDGPACSNAPYLNSHLIEVFRCVEVLHVAHWQVQLVIGAEVLEIVVEGKSILIEQTYFEFKSEILLRLNFVILIIEKLSVEFSAWQEKMARNKYPREINDIVKRVVS